MAVSSQAYPSKKPLASWTRDLVLRVEQFAKWASTTHPPIHFWMSAFTFPTGFLTAVLQTAARKNNVRERERERKRERERERKRERKRERVFGSHHVLKHEEEERTLYCLWKYFDTCHWRGPL